MGATRNDLQRVTERRESAEKRRLARLNRSDRQQLARLDAAFGVGQGARRERARLEKRIEEADKQLESEKEE